MPTIAELFDQAIRFHQNGDLPRAEALYQEILRTEPYHADTLNRLGILALQTGHFQAAVDLIGQACALNPTNPDFHCNLGFAYQNQGKLTKAAKCFHVALRGNPNHEDATNNLGIVLVREDRYDEAIQCFRKVISGNPNHELALNNLGNALTVAGELAEAAQCYQRALRINPSRPGVHANLGVVLVGLGQLAEAAECYRQALLIDADPSTALAKRSFLRLLQGDFERGWQEYEQRLVQPSTPQRSFEQPRWDGAPLAGKTILVHAEQGLGDAIQFMRYLPMIQGCGGKVVFECRAPLHGLLAGIPGVDQLAQEGGPLPPFDVQVPLLSLPCIFRTTLETIPANIPLAADPKLVEHWHKEMVKLSSFSGEPTATADIAPKFNIGIVWQGNPKVIGDKLRSIPLKYFEPLARIPGVRLVSLQKGPGLEQIPGLGGRFPILDLSDRLETFNDTAAVMKNLDLIITSDTFPAHLAGTLEIPVWTILQLVPDWRWFLGRPDSPWYPTMRLFRQVRFGDWGEVFQRVAGELSLLLKKGG